MTDNFDSSYTSTEPTTFDDALVCFADGSRARFTRVEFLPDGRLKAVLTRSVGDELRATARSDSHTITETAYFAPGSYISVQGPRRGALVADTASERHIVKLNLLTENVREAIEKFVWHHWGLPLYPRIDDVSDENLIDRQFSVWDEEGNGVAVDTVTFRWVWPNGHDQPIQQLARVPRHVEQQQTS